MGTPDSREYDRLVERGFKPYSMGHRRMYEKAIFHLLGEKRPLHIVEAGFGIGWGLDQMVEAGIVRRYTGFEPNRDSFNYVAERYAGKAGWDGANMALLNEAFPPGAVAEGFADATVCIEVIEHVPMDDHANFLRALRSLAPVLYFSTPDIRRQPREGVRTASAWGALLEYVGFTRVDIDASEWTTFYRARR